MSWKQKLLGDVISTQKGFAFKSSQYTETGIPIVRVSNFTMDSIALDDLKYYPLESKTEYSNFILHNKDVIIQTVGSWPNNPASVVGKVVRVPLYLEGSFLNQNAVKLIPHHNIDNRFLFYRLKTEEFKGHVLGEARGAANQASITLDTIKSYSFKLPPIEIQHRIADILSAYDDLIENNQKQIKLLEEAAQRLYKEWFVDLYFPGWEHTKITDGIPDGWEKLSLSDFADVVMGQSPKSEFYNQDKQGLPFHQGVGSYGNRYVIDDTYSTSFTRIAEPNSILFSVRAPVGRLNITKNKIVIGRGLSALNHKKGYQSYLFYLLKEKYFKDNIIGNGSIFASITKAELLTQEFLIAPDDLISRFNMIVSEFDEKIKALDRLIGLLIEVRDRLLPKLMSGELED